MSVLQRLTALFVLLALTCLGGVAVLRLLHEKELARMYAQVTRERQELLRDALELEGRNLRDFVTDYSYWDELVAFLPAPSDEWARVNLAPGLNSFDAHHLWVLAPDGTVIRHLSRSPDGPAPDSFPGDPAFLAELSRQRFLHFFLRAPAGVFELRTAPIQPSADTQRKSEPRGWLIAARYWDESHVTNFASLLSSHVSLSPVDAPLPSAGSGRVVFGDHLQDWRGQGAAQIQAVYRSQLLATQEESNQSERLTFLLAAATVLALLLTGVAYGVVLPLRQLAGSIATADAKLLESLPRFGREFASLAGVVGDFFRQRRELEQEVETRRRAEELLRASEAQLRDLTLVRSRLARDLHDGIIQSLYSAGLSIESERQRLASQSHPAADRLAAVTAGLNQCIREVRTFINSLESEADATPNLKESVPALVRTLQALHPQNFELKFDAAAADQLNPRQQRHILQIIREAVSNSLRHSGCRTVRISLMQVAGAHELTIEDDGCGFDFGSRSTNGRGLENMHSRAEEAGASIRIDSSNRQGTQVHLRFPKPATP